jgi:hypothetical protein
MLPYAVDLKDAYLPESVTAGFFISETVFQLSYVVLPQHLLVDNHANISIELSLKVETCCGVGFDWHVHCIKRGSCLRGELNDSLNSVLTDTLQTYLQLYGIRCDYFRVIASNVSVNFI